MTLRGDIREYFTREAAAIPPPAGLRASVTAEALRDMRAERRGMRLAAVVAAALAVAIVAGLVAAGSLRHINPPVLGIKAGQHGMVLDATAVDGSHGWALLAQCVVNQASPTDLCPYWVESTRDGGRTWVSPVKLASYPLTDGDAPRHIRFADRMNGFVFGNGVAFATHDGGAHWTPLFAGVSGIVDIEGRGAVWAVTYPCAKGTQCPYAVYISHDGGKTWIRTAALPSGFSPRFAVPFGSTGLLLTGFGAGDVAVTRNGGSSWNVIGGRCSPDVIESYVATADGEELWELCAGSPSVQGDSGLWMSEDGGATWKRGADVGQVTTGAVLTSPARGTAFILVSTNGSVPAPELVSNDAGRSWQPVGGAGEFVTVSFAGSTVWAVDNQFTVWGSNDGGYTWAKLPAQP